MTRPRTPTLDARAGQATTEYFLVIAVVCIAMVAAAYIFLPGFRRGFTGLDQDVQTVLNSGSANGSGQKR